MLRIATRWGIVVAAALSAPLLGACLNDHLADDCHNTYSCPLPDAGDGGDAAAEDP
jgi:hypothetical protein